MHHGRQAPRLGGRQGLTTPAVAFAARCARPSCQPPQAAQICIAALPTNARVPLRAPRGNHHVRVPSGGVTPRRRVGRAGRRRSSNSALSNRPSRRAPPHDDLVADRAVRGRVEVREFAGQAAAQLVDREIPTVGGSSWYARRHAFEVCASASAQCASVISASAVCHAVGNGTPARRAASRASRTVTAGFTPATR